jgi:hypothetical protein
MAIYSMQKLISQARILARDYRQATGKTLPGISNEIAENDAAHLLGLTLCDDRSQGFDATDANGKKIQIKARTIFDDSKTGQRIGQIKSNQSWDSVVLVLLNEDYEPFEIYEAEREVLIEVIDKPSQNQKKRGALSVARFKIIGELRWTIEEGLEN